MARDTVLAGEAADEIAANAPPGDEASIAASIEGHVEAPDQEPGQADRDQHVEDVAQRLAIAVRLLRRFIEQTDVVDMPYTRVIGRIVHVLTVNSPRDWCTATPITVALLLFLPEHLNAVHRQSGTDRRSINVTAWNLQALLYDRLKKLISESWGMARKASNGRGYQLTEDGRFVFDEWPEDIVFDPHNADLWKRNQANTRGGSSLPVPDSQR